MIVRSANGVRFFVRVVFKGERYGLEDRVVHDEDEPLIEFFDFDQDKKKFGPRGQFVTRYYAKTLAPGPDHVGLDLQYGIPRWQIDGRNLQPVRELARVLSPSQDVPVRIVDDEPRRAGRKVREP